MSPDMKNYKAPDAFQIIEEEHAGYILLIFIVAAIVFDLLPK